MYSGISSIGYMVLFWD